MDKLESGQDVTGKKCHQPAQFATFAHIAGAVQATIRRSRTAKDNIIDKRLTELCNWVTQFKHFEKAIPVPASTDASFRRYFRVQGDQSRIVMDAPGSKEDCRTFVDIAAILAEIGLNAPQVIEANLDKGFILMSDLGTTQYLDALAEEPSRAPELYRDALDALLLLQREGKRFRKKLPPYDHAKLSFELSLFKEWLCERHLGIEFDAAEQAAWRDGCTLLINNALSQPQVFVHLDYHSRNLMVCEDQNPGILDFQDAREGPLTYDLVSLLRDCYIKWPVEMVSQWVSYFFERLPEAVKAGQDRDAFVRDFDLMGVQRHLKAAGIFARLKIRDDKGRYLADVPRTLGYIVDVAPRYPALSGLLELLEGRVLPALQSVTS